ncbi:MAG TPA: Rrf2 family transcriptional regulator [Flavobacteriales bacterium]
MLSKRAKYALNALRVLAQGGDDAPLSAALIAERARVPGKFLEAILLDLNRAGMVGSRKGRGGGHFLRRTPEEIRMTDVLRHFDGAIGLVPCVTHNYYERCEECVDERTCGFHDVFADIRAATVEMLKNATLADVLQREQRLSRKSGRKVDK